MTITRDQFEKISQLTAHAEEGILLSKLTTFRIGGAADVVIEPENSDELARLLVFLNGAEIPWFILGAGSNVLFHDAGFKGAIIRMNRMNDLSIKLNGSEMVKIIAGPGLPLSKLVNEGCSRGFTGLEELWGIPGSVGGAAAVNAGAGAVCMGNLLTRIALIEPSGVEKVIDKGQIKFGYRKLNLPKDSIINRLEMTFAKADSEIVVNNLEKAKRRRKQNQPIGAASAGCVFKNPDPNNPAGLLIDKAGLKGFTRGGAVISPSHANFIVNTGGATAADVRYLINLIRNGIKADHGIELELEIQIIGEGGARES